jgi:hypothetical protein
MPTETVLKALDQYDSIMQKYAPTLLPLIWDINKKRLLYNGMFSSYKATLWHCNMVICVELGFGGGCGLVLFLQLIGIGTPLSFFQILVLLVGVSLGIMMVGFHILIVLYTEIGSYGWNELCSVEKKLTVLCKTIKYVFYITAKLFSVFSQKRKIKTRFGWIHNDAGYLVIRCLSFYIGFWCNASKS